jgi:hypothetical protein
MEFAIDVALFDLMKEDELLGAVGTKKGIDLIPKCALHRRMIIRSAYRDPNLAIGFMCRRSSMVAGTRAYPYAPLQRNNPAPEVTERRAELGERGFHT